MSVKEKIKNLIRNLSFQYWKARCKYSLILEGTVGLTRIILQMPKIHIISILRKYGADVGDGCDIDIGLLLHRIRLPLSNLIIEDNAYLGHNIFIDLTERVRIGKESAISSRTLLITHTVNWTKDRRDEHEVKGRIELGKAVIIYSGAIICPGVKIGDYARVGANSTVLKDIAPYKFAAGSPAEVKRDRRVTEKFQENNY